MRRPGWWGPLLLGLACFAAADLWPVATPAVADADAGLVAVVSAEPLAAALLPLGPARALVSAGLWVRFLQSHVESDAEALAWLSEGLLAVHPELERVREHLASQLIVTTAPAAPDDARHRALVQRGLGMLEDGLELSDSQRLHGALGRLLVVQSRHDPRFGSAARQYFGMDPTDLAIDELRSAGDSEGSSVFLADLLVDRGIDAWLRDRDLHAADRDLAEAERLTRSLPGDDAAELAGRIAAIRTEMREPAAEHERP